jgi:hypothetical protein
MMMALVSKQISFVHIVQVKRQDNHWKNNVNIHGLSVFVVNDEHSTFAWDHSIHLQLMCHAKLNRCRTILHSAHSCTQQNNIFRQCSKTYVQHIPIYKYTVFTIVSRKELFEFTV